MRKLLIGLVVIVVVLILIKKKNMTWRESILKAVYPVIMLPGKLFGSQKGFLNTQHKTAPMNFYQLSIALNNGQTISMEQFKGKKLLLVNTASACGYTGQYAELEELYKKYKDELVIIGFPANDFKQQEQKNDDEIAEFCKVNYGVTFLLAKKSSVIKSAEQNPVFAWLSDKEKNGWNDQEPTWNFCKYLVNEEGVLEAFFPQTVSPLDKSVVQLLVK
jgi:glutathione peroxidase